MIVYYYCTLALVHAYDVSLPSSIHHGAYVMLLLQLVIVWVQFIGSDRIQVGAIELKLEIRHKSLKSHQRRICRADDARYMTYYVMV